MYKNNISLDKCCVFNTGIFDKESKFCPYCKYPMVIVGNFLIILMADFQIFNNPAYELSGK